MRLMSFALTREQVRARTKRVTRRIGWGFLKPGDRLRAVEKTMGFRKGERAVTLAIIEVADVRREALDAITPADVAAEGFPGMTPAQFVAMFRGQMGCPAQTIVTRVEFAYVEDAEVSP